MSRVAVMCGHGKSKDGSWDCGTTYAGYSEAALMLPITKAAVRYLRDYGVEVISDADTNNDKNMLVDVAWANRIGVDAYISIHCDWYKAVSGVMPLYVSSDGKLLATCLNNSIRDGIPMKSRGVCRRTDLWELNGTDAVACILETGSIKADLSILKNEPDKYGKLIAQGICDYLGVAAVPKADPEPAQPVADDGKLEIDGIGGPLTVKAMQRFFGTPVDGKISGQRQGLHEEYFPAFTAVEYGGDGSVVVTAIQRWCSITRDGIWGEQTSQALQKKVGAETDGIFGPESVKALQAYLNEHDKAEYPTVVSEPVKAAELASKKSNSAQKIVNAAKSYAWPKGTPDSTIDYDTGKARPAYKKALKKHMKKSAKVSQTDCGYFVSTCVRTALGNGFKALPGKASQNYPAVPGDMKIVSEGKVRPLKAGDIVRYRKTGGSGQHTVIYLGDGKIASASREHKFPRISNGKPWNNDNVKKSTIQVIRAK